MLSETSHTNAYEKKINNIKFLLIKITLFHASSKTSLQKHYLFKSISVRCICMYL